ncbi:hypothetical protein O988_00946 [Pseudogymnoascus sp. VKM F-3808]|nr:hypothetical protein O988_00946 [Pseudogymnoascus sp. VKM F-3808]
MSSSADNQAGGRSNTAPNNYGPVIVDSATYKLTPIEESNEEDPDIAGAVEALEQITLREIGNGYIVDTPRAVANLVDSLVDLPTTPPSLYLDIEGVNLGRRGAVSIVQLLVLPTNLTYLIDIHTLNNAAFTTAGTHGHTLQSILEDSSIPKVFFDVRNDSAALHSRFSISLAGIHDIQLMELATRPSSKKFLHGLARCISSDLSLGRHELRRWTDQKSRGKRLFAPELGGTYEVFNERPMGEDIALYCTQDVQFMPKLWAYYEARLTALSINHYIKTILDTMSENSKHEIEIEIHILFFTSATNPQSPGDVALWFKNKNSDPFLIHLAGPRGSYCLGIKDNCYPSASTQFRDPIIMGSKKPATKDQIVALVSQVPIVNSSSFNSKALVGDALKRLTEQRYIEREDYLRAVGEMIDVTEGGNGRA